MGLAEVQQGLARLLTDEALREQFASDAPTVGRAMGLEAHDVDCLQAFAAPHVARFGHSLRVKRWNEVEKLLPLSSEATCRADFPLRQWFLQFAQTTIPQGSKRHAQDAIAFAEWAASETNSNAHNLPTDTQTPMANVAWLPDLLRYEAASLTMRISPSRRWLLRRFSYSIPQFARESIQSQKDATLLKSPARQSTWGGWFRLRPASKLYVVEIYFQKYWKIDPPAETLALN